MIKLKENRAIMLFRTVIITVLLTITCHTTSWSQQAGGSVEQAEKNIAKKRKDRAKATAKADKEGKKRFMSIQSKETQKRMKKQQKELKKRARKAKREKRRNR